MSVLAREVGLTPHKVRVRPEERVWEQTKGCRARRHPRGFQDGTAGTELSSGLKRRKDLGQAGSTVSKVPLQSTYFIKIKRNNAHEVGSFTGLADP